MVHLRWQLYKKKPIRMYPAKWESLASEQSSGLHTHTPSAAAAAAKSLQLCLTLCDPIDGSPPGSPNPGILQARTLEWVAIAFSNAWKWKVKVKSLSRVRLFTTPWTAAHQALLSMGFARQEYWSGVPLPSPSMLLPLFKQFSQPFHSVNVLKTFQCSQWWYIHVLWECI